jgi:hypothetical protein
VAKYSITPFKGIVSEVSPKLLPEGFSTECTNCFLDTGSLQAWHQPSFVTDLGKTGVINTLSLLAGNTWLHFNEGVDIALAPIANNDKFYSVITGLDKPRYTNTDLAVAGSGTTWPNVTYWLGIPAPTLQMLATVSQGTPDGIQFQWSIAGTEEDSIGNKLTYSYVYTFVDSNGREGPPSKPSELVFASTDDIVTLSNIEALSGAYDPSGLKIRIYRSENGSPFQFLSEEASGITTFVDDFTKTAGTAIESTLWSPPPDDLRGIVTLANGMMAGYVGNDLYLSEPYQPHAWPEDYIQHVDYPIKGLAASGNTVIVTTERYPYIGVGNHPSVFTLDKLETIQGNTSLKSLVDIGSGAMYASNDGIVMISNGSSATVITKDFISESTWRELNPSSIHGAFYREKYFGFYDSGKTTAITTENGETIPPKGGFIVDIQKQFITFTDEWGSAIYSDMNTGEVFYVKTTGAQNKVYKWNDLNNGYMSFKWTSKPFVIGASTLVAGRAELKKGTAILKLYADKKLKYTTEITNTDVFRLPSGYQAREFYITLEGTGIVDAIHLATEAASLY